MFYYFDDMIFAIVVTLIPGMTIHVGDLLVNKPVTTADVEEKPVVDQSESPGMTINVDDLIADKPKKTIDDNIGTKQGKQINAENLRENKPDKTNENVPLAETEGLTINIGDLIASKKPPEKTEEVDDLMEKTCWMTVQE